jgi:hypothetical protein
MEEPLFTLCHLGEQKQINADLIGELVSYSICRIDEGKPIPVRARPSSLEDVQDQSRKSLNKFLTDNAAFVKQLADLFLKHELEFQLFF